MKIFVFEEEVEVKVFEEGGFFVEENFEIVDENEMRIEIFVFEEELDVLVFFIEKDIIYVECMEEDSLVDCLVVFEEEVEVLVFLDEFIEECEVEFFVEYEEEDVDCIVVNEEEFEIIVCKIYLE